MNKRRILSFFLYIAFLVVLLTVSIEILLRLGVARPTFLSKAGTAITLDRKLLFRIVPRSNPEINNMGYRDSDFSREKKDKKRILFYGDSFVFGIGVYSPDTLPQALETALGGPYEVYNMGVYGYGPDQSLMQLLEEGLRFKPDMVILGVHPANDFEDINKNKLYHISRDGKLRYNPLNVIGALMSPLDIIYQCRYLRFKHNLKGLGLPPSIEGDAGDDFKNAFEAVFMDGYDLDLMKNINSGASLRKTALMKGILKKFRDVLKERGIEFLVVIIPSYANIQNDDSLRAASIPGGNYLVNERTMGILCDMEKIPYIDLSEVFLRGGHPEAIYGELYDHHLSRYGNWFSAGVIARYIQRGGP